MKGADKFRLQKDATKALGLDLGYRDAMGWAQALPEDSVVEAALKRAHEIRQFEISLYWQRANYFWLLQAAVMTAFAVLLSAEDKSNRIPLFLPFALACLGFLCAYAGWLSSKGSKFWQSNWEKHIDMLEDPFEGKLHKTVWIGSKGISHSVSRLNSEVILIFVGFWTLCCVFYPLTFLQWRALSLGYPNTGNAKNATECLFILAFTIIAAWRLWNQWTAFTIDQGRRQDSIENMARCQQLDRSIRASVSGFWRMPIPWRRSRWIERSDITGDGT